MQQLSLLLPLPLPRQETPVYRVSIDPSQCTVLELLAVAVGGPNQLEIAGSIFAHFAGDLHLLFQASVAELVSIAGVDEEIAVRLKASFVLSRRLPMMARYRDQIRSPADIAGLCDDMLTFGVEHFRVFTLDVKGRVLASEDLYRGTLNSSPVKVAEVFRSAIQRNAGEIAVAHAHPSGQSDPGPEDVELTEALVQAGKLLSIPVLDHVILGHGQFCSMREKGLGFPPSTSTIMKGWS